MSQTEIHPEVRQAADILLSAPDEIGLYEISSYAKYDLHISDDEEVKRITLEVVREMLHRGAWADFDMGYPSGKLHPEKTPDEIVARIDREWTALNRRPSIGDICHFEWTPAAMEAYEKAKCDGSASPDRPPS